MTHHQLRVFLHSDRSERLADNNRQVPNMLFENVKKQLDILDTDMKPINSHILAFGNRAWMTNNGFEEALIYSKRLGFKGMVVIPALFMTDGSEVTMTSATRLAIRHDMNLVVCLFLSGLEVSPYAKGGAITAITMLKKQLDWQLHFFKNNVAKQNVTCGPALDNWRSGIKGYKAGGFDGLLDFATHVARLGERNDTIICAEVLNGGESGIYLPHKIIPQVIRKVDSKHLRLHFDVVHFASHIGMPSVMDHLQRHVDITKVVEFGMPGRYPMMDVHGFGVVAPRMFQYLQDAIPKALLSVEPFDYEDVIKSFGLEGVYECRQKGTEVLSKDALFLAEHGMLLSEVAS